MRNTPSSPLPGSNRRQKWLKLSPAALPRGRKRTQRISHRAAKQQNNKKPKQELQIHLIFHTDLNSGTFLTKD